jgi:hypothetical protein
VHGQVSRSATLEDLANVVTDLAVRLVEPGAVTCQTPCHDELTKEVHRRDCTACREGDDLIAAQDKSASLATRRASALSLLIVSNAASISLALAAFKVKTFFPITRAAEWMSSSCVCA